MFKILKYLSRLKIVKESDSHYTCICPVCGDDNFKINRRGRYVGAYKCWSNLCSNTEVKDHLGYKEFAPPPPKHNYITKLKPLPVSFRGSSVVTCPNYIPIKSVITRYIGNYCTKETIYQYSNTQRVLRIDNLDTQTKYVFIQTRQEDFTWSSGMGSETWPIYKRGLENIISDPNFDTLIVVEGEKTAEALKEKGLAAITFVGPSFHSPLNKTLLVFKSLYPHIKNFLYCPDYDEPGEKKAQRLREECWRVGLACDILGIEEIVSSPEPGMDLADVDENTIKTFIQYVTGRYSVSFRGIQERRTELCGTN
jgi:hypothetical protein